jgi:hypothetical protein
MTLMTRAEAEAQCQQWWGYAWTAVQGAIARLYCDLPGDANTKIGICHRLSKDIQGEMHLHRTGSWKCSWPLRRHRTWTITCG